MIIGGKSGGGPAGAPGTTPGSEIVNVTEREFEKEVLRSQVPVLLEFSAEWCQPCKVIAPEIEALAKELRGKVKVVKVDVDRSPMIAQQLRIQSVPTFMIFVGGRIADAQAGATSKQHLRDMLDPFLPRAAGAMKPREVFELLKGGAVVAVDTRDAAAYGRAHIPGAKNMPIEDLENRLAELYMLADNPVLYCRSGDKTKELCARLAEQGTPIAFLEGGFLSWEADSLPIERP